MIAINRTLERESAAALHSAGKRRPVIVELAPPGTLVGFRLKGTRRTYYLPIDWCFREAMRAEVSRQRAERRKARKAAKQ